MFRRFSNAHPKGPKNRKAEGISLFLTLLLILFLRAFVAEPFKIPSGSMIPTLLVGDHLFVAKSSYDIRIPFTNVSVLKVADPKRGDVVVFGYPHFPQTPEMTGTHYIKRLIGLPGDVISIQGGTIRVNDEAWNKVPLDPAAVATEIPNFRPHPTESLLFKESIPGQEGFHWAQHKQSSLRRLSEAKETYRLIEGQDCVEVGSGIRGGIPDSTLVNEVCQFTVPAGHYFFMGDNRDDSSDGRTWGFVERKLLRGRALFIWLPFKSFSFQTDEEGGPLLRWRRFGLRIL